MNKHVAGGRRRHPSIWSARRSQKRAFLWKRPPIGSPYMTTIVAGSFPEPDLALGVQLDAVRLLHDPIAATAVRAMAAGLGRDGVVRHAMSVVQDGDVGKTAIDVELDLPLAATPPLTGRTAGSSR